MGEIKIIIKKNPKHLLDSKAGNQSANTEYVCKTRGKFLILEIGKRFEIAGEQSALPFMPGGTDKLCINNFPSL